MRDKKENKEKAKDKKLKVKLGNMNQSEAKKKTIGNGELAKKVMVRIKRGDIKMRPAVYFALAAMLLGAGWAGSLVVATFFVNLVFFRLRVLGSWGWLCWGSFGRLAFLRVFPWAALLLAVGGLVAGISFLRRYDFSYRRGWWGLVLGVVATVVTLGVLIDRGGLNARLTHTPRWRGLYQSQFTGQHWLVGEVAEVDNQQLILVTPLGESRVVTWDSTTRFLPLEAVEVGDRVRVLGQQAKDVFAAEVIAQGVPNGKGLFSPHPAVKGSRRRLLPNHLPSLPAD